MKVPRFTDRSMHLRLKRARTLLVLSALLAGCGPTAAATADGSPWMYRAWQSDDGLPDISIVGLTQTSDGYLWVATKAGLLSFNGRDFSLVPRTHLVDATARPVRTLLRDRCDRLWLGMERGPLLCLDHDGVTNLTSLAGLPGQRVEMMAEDGDGGMFVVYSGRQIFRVANHKAERIPVPGDPASTRGILVASDRTGALWCAVGNELFIRRPGTWERIAHLEDPVTTIGTSQQEGVWIAAGRRISRVKTDRSVTEIAQWKFKSVPRTILEDRSGALWVGTFADGLVCWNGRQFERVATSDLEITCLAEDHENNIWVGTAGGGLNQIRPRVVELIDRADGLPFASVISVTKDQSGGLWAVGLDGRLARGRDGRWDLVRDSDGWSGGLATCVVADPAGGVWVGTRDRGLRRFFENRWDDRFGKGNAPCEGIRSLWVTARGDLWAAGLFGNRLYRVRDSIVDSVSPAPAANHAGASKDAREDAIRALAEAADGTIWAGTAEGRILKVDSDAMISETVDHDPTHPSVRSLLAMPDGGLWIGYAGDGLGHLKAGRYRQLTTREGLADDFISQLLTDDSGNLWLAGNRGLSRVSLADLEAVVAGQAERVSARRFGSADGLKGLQPNRDYWPSAWRAEDGQLWFSLRNGLLSVKPGSIGENPVAPVLRIERVELDDQPVAFYKAGTPFQTHSGGNFQRLDGEDIVLQLGPSHRKLEIHFAALSYASPENVQFRHQLVGFDAGWIGTGNRNSATYPRLPSGRYEFRITACNSAGVWNDRPASVILMVEPFVWETWWFRLAVGCGAMLAAGFCVHAISRARFKRRLLQSEARRALEQERTRIARDIHDELGTSLTRIVMLSQPDGDPPAGQNPEMNRIYETARNLTRTMDEVVWAVNPRQDTLEGLISYLTAFAQEFTSGANVACRLELPEHLPSLPLSAEIRHNVFLAAKEAIHNAVRHGRPGMVAIALQVRQAGFMMTITDDGIGFDTAARPGGRVGNGLGNMRDRLAAIGGQCTITSQPRVGTSVAFVVTLPHGRPL